MQGTTRAGDQEEEVTLISGIRFKRSDLQRFQAEQEAAAAGVPVVKVRQPSIHVHIVYVTPSTVQTRMLNSQPITLSLQ